MNETTATTTEGGATTHRQRATRTAAGEGPAYWFFGALAVIRSPEDARPIIIEMTVPPGGHTPLHVHTNLDDSYSLLSGRLAVRCGDETFVAHAGDYVSRPPGVPHTFFALDEKPAVLLQTHANDDFLNFIRQGGVPATSRIQPSEQPLDFDALYQVAVATGQPVIGPPMTEAGTVLPVWASVQTSNRNASRHRKACQPRDSAWCTLLMERESHVGREPMISV